MKFDTILFEEKDSIALITLNRPKKLNAFNQSMLFDLLKVFDHCDQSDSIKAIIITGSGRAFCAGADLRREKSESNVPKLEGADDISLMLRHLYKPVICKIQGSVLAGALLMVTNSTHAVAVKDAKFSAPEILRGLWPHMVMAGLFRVMPKRAGLDFVMRGQPIDAAKAKEWGLINDFVAAEELEESFSSEELDYNDIESGLDLFSKISQDEIMDYIENENVTLSKKKDPLDHQIKAIAEAKKYYASNDRGKMIMACGTGKTYTSLKIAEAIANKKLVLYKNNTLYYYLGDSIFYTLLLVLILIIIFPQIALWLPTLLYGQ